MAKKAKDMKYDTRIMEILNDTPVGSEDMRILEAVQRYDREKANQAARLAEKLGTPDEKSSQYQRREPPMDFRPLIVPRSTYSELRRRVTTQR